MSKRFTVKIGCHFVSEERFNKSVTTLVSIEYNWILSKFMHFFRVTKWLLHLLVLYSGRVSLTTVALVDDSASFFFLPLPIVWGDAILFDPLGGSFEPAVPSLIHNFVSSRTTSRDMVSITKFYFKHTACALVKNYINPLIHWCFVKCVWHIRHVKWLHYSVCLMESMHVRHTLLIFILQYVLLVKASLILNVLHRIYFLP